MQWYPEIKHHSPGTPIILVGTKVDLKDDPEVREQLRQRGMAPVLYENVVKFKEEKLTKNGITTKEPAFPMIKKYVECSALSQRGLKQVFDEAIKSVSPPS